MTTLLNILNRALDFFEDMISEETPVETFYFVGRK